MKQFSYYVVMYTDNGYTTAHVLLNTPIRTYDDVERLAAVIRNRSDSPESFVITNWILLGRV